MRVCVRVCCKSVCVCAVCICVWFAVSRTALERISSRETETEAGAVACWPAAVVVDFVCMYICMCVYVRCMLQQTAANAARVACCMLRLHKDLIASVI